MNARTFLENSFLTESNFYNLKITLSYLGKSFQGFQSQEHGNTVQNTLEKAWEIVAHEKPKLNGCSRLDSGVHAREYVLNLFTATKISSENLLRSLNGVLSSNLKVDIAIQTIEKCDSAFHARFNAVGKWYRYLLWHGRARHALYTPHCWRINSSRFDTVLPSVLKRFEGQHDFSAFRASDCSNLNTIKTIHKIKIKQHKEFSEMYLVDIFGTGFLKNMVRNIVGTAVDVCCGKMNIDNIDECFKHGNRSLAGQCAPAHALTLWKVYYGVEEFEKDLNYE
jgi:tRNA pseudouridine38-40 synthase